VAWAGSNDQLLKLWTRSCLCSGWS